MSSTPISNLTPAAQSNIASSRPDENTNPQDRVISQVAQNRIKRERDEGPSEPRNLRPSNPQNPLAQLAAVAQIAPPIQNPITGVKSSNDIFIEFNTELNNFHNKVSNEIKNISSNINKVMLIKSKGFFFKQDFTQELNLAKQTLFTSIKHFNTETTEIIEDIIRLKKKHTELKRIPDWRDENLISGINSTNYNKLNSIVSALTFGIFITPLVSLQPSNINENTLFYFSRTLGITNLGFYLESKECIFDLFEFMYLQCKIEKNPSAATVSDDAIKIEVLKHNIRNHLQPSLNDSPILTHIHQNLEALRHLHEATQELVPKELKVYITPEKVLCKRSSVQNHLEYKFLGLGGPDEEVIRIKDHSLNTINEWLQSESSRFGLSSENFNKSFWAELINLKFQLKHSSATKGNLRSFYQTIDSNYIIFSIQDQYVKKEPWFAEVQKDWTEFSEYLFKRKSIEDLTPNSSLFVRKLHEMGVRLENKNQLIDIFFDVNLQKIMRGYFFIVSRLGAKQIKPQQTSCKFRSGPE